jgi:hypothetical protein
VNDFDMVECDAGLCGDLLKTVFDGDGGIGWSRAQLKKLETPC